MADNARGEKKTYVIGPIYSAVQRLVLRTGNNGTNETDGFFVKLGADPQPYGVYGKGLQRRMAEKDAVSCFVIYGS